MASDLEVEVNIEGLVGDCPRLDVDIAAGKSQLHFRRGSRDFYIVISSDVASNPEDDLSEATVQEGADLASPVGLLLLSNTRQLEHVHEGVLPQVKHSNLNFITDDHSLLPGFISRVSLVRYSIN